MRRVFIVALAVASVTILPPPAPAQDSPRPADETINLRRTVTVEVVAKTKDAVVNISTTKLVQQRFSPFGFDPFWDQFDFGDAHKVPTSSLGSGFILHKTGYVVTNHHVIDKARQIQVELTDGRKLTAELVSSDADADLAILRIRDQKSFPALPLGDSSDLLIGEPVLAVGNPLGFSHSVSTGIVSAVHRDLKDAGGRVMLSDLIQTDAAINPGNSGGPLLNAYGQVIGINTAIRGDAQNIGFAIQVNRLRDLIPDLMNPAQVTNVNVPIRLTEARTVTEPASVKSTVKFEHQGRSAEIVKINAHEVSNIVDAYVALLDAVPGEAVAVTTSDGQTIEIHAHDVPLPDAIVRAREKLGVTGKPLTPMVAEEYQLATEDGLLVVEVARDTPAERAGVQPGDVVVSFGRYPVTTLDSLASLLQHVPERGRIRVGIVRGNQQGYLMLDL